MLSYSQAEALLTCSLTLILGTWPGTEYMGMNHNHYEIHICSPGMDTPF